MDDEDEEDEEEEQRDLRRWRLEFWGGADGGLGIRVRVCREGRGEEREREFRAERAIRNARNMVCFGGGYFGAVAACSVCLKGS